MSSTAPVPMPIMLPPLSLSLSFCPLPLSLTYSLCFASYIPVYLMQLISLSLHRSYVINCTSANAPTITGLIGNTTDLSILFESGDGVQYGTDYICTIRLTYLGNTSVEGRGIPITTLENVGKCIPDWYQICFMKSYCTLMDRVLLRH